MRFGLVGTGTIGAGWAVRALSRGWDVVAHDPAAGAENRLLEAVDRAWPSVAELGLYPGADRLRLRFVSSLEEVAGEADFVQESVPEDLARKQRVLGEIDAAAPLTAIVASSTSGLLPTDLAAQLTHPGRFVVGHPFNPVYLLPLVEVVAGEATSQSTIDRAVETYADLDMHPLIVRNQVPGFLSDRLQEALWREILHLVNDGVATTEELDRSIVYGPGLRWAGMGTNLTYHLAGGEDGMRRMLEQFGPALEWPWTKLIAPPLTNELIERMVNGTREQAGGRSIAELERIRDEYLLAVMSALRRTRIGAGEMLNRREQRILTAGAPLLDEVAEPPVDRLSLGVHREAEPGADGRTIPTYDIVPPTEWIDYNGHLTEWAYARVFADATDAALTALGFGSRYRETERGTFYTVENHLRFLREIPADTPVSTQVSVVGVDRKRLHLAAVLTAGTSEPAATFESLLLHVDVDTTRVRPMPEWLSDRARDELMDPPDWLGRSIVRAESSR